MSPTARPPLDRIELRPIGHVRTAHRRLDDTPIQTWRNPDGPGRLVLLEQYAAALDGLEGFDYAHLICFLDRAWEADGRGTRPFTGDRLRPVPFLLQETGQRVGVFATRVPVRPNYLALSLVRVVAVPGTPSTSPASTCSTAPRCWTSSRSSPTSTCPATPAGAAGSTISTAAGTPSTTPPPTPWSARAARACEASASTHRRVTTGRVPRSRDDRRPGRNP